MTRSEQPSVQPSVQRSPVGKQPGERRRGWLERRREKVVAEIQRNRRGEYTVPTWVLAAILAAVVAAWAAIILLA